MFLKPFSEQWQSPFFSTVYAEKEQVMLLFELSNTIKKAITYVIAFYIQVSEDYLYLRFLAASDFFLRLTLGFS